MARVDTLGCQFMLNLLGFGYVLTSWSLRRPTLLAHELGCHVKHAAKATSRATAAATTAASAHLRLQIELKSHLCSLRNGVLLSSTRILRVSVMALGVCCAYDLQSCPHSVACQKVVLPVPWPYR